MLTLLLYALLAIAVVAVLFGLAVAVLPRGEQISAPTPDTRPWPGLPDRPMRPDDVVAVRLPVALRGYRFAETDLLLDRLGEELRARDEEIARLRAGRYTGEYAGGDYASGDYVGDDYAGGDYASGDYAGGDYAGDDYAGGEYAGGDYAGDDYARHDGDE